MDRLDLRVEPGERVLLVGPSGAGKSTLLRAFAGLLLTADVGDLSGSVTIDGRPPQERPGTVGLLLQDPSAAVVAERVGRDVAFGLENLRVPRAEMAPRVRQALDAVGFPYGEDRHTRALSGGELQRLALAGALALEPRVLLLDEPTAMLDDGNAAGVRQAVLDLCAARGTTLVVVEHRIEQWLPHVDRCVVLGADGAVVADGPAHEVLHGRGSELASAGVWVPGVPPPVPDPLGADLVAPAERLADGSHVVRARDVAVRYRSLVPLGRRPDATPALVGVDADVWASRPLAVTGASGSGKSTLLAVLAGLVTPDEGLAELVLDSPLRLTDLDSRDLARRLTWVTQLPEHAFVAGTVLDEVLATSRALGLPAEPAEERGRALLAALGLSGLEGRNPHTLSGGEQRRLLLAACMVHGPQVLLVDEPTLAQDRLTWAAVTGLLGAALDAGCGVVAATHDPDLLAFLGARGTGRLDLPARPR